MVPYMGQLFRSLFPRFSSKPFPVPWNESRVNSKTCPIVSRMRGTWQATRTARSCLSSWITFEALSSIFK